MPHYIQLYSHIKIKADILQERRLKVVEKVCYNGKQDLNVTKCNECILDEYTFLKVAFVFILVNVISNM